jgi:hypothetical protein
LTLIAAEFYHNAERQIGAKQMVSNRENASNLGARFDPTRHAYTSILTNLDVESRPPNYDIALEWMQNTSAPHVSYDIWARGNYTSRLIDLRKRDVRPLLIAVKTVAEMQWAYRRTALLGIPVEFIYTGGVSATQKILHIYPEQEYWDGACGYIVAAGSKARMKGRDWYPIFGYSQLMPRQFAHWLATEVADEFRNGEIFVSPAEHVGIDPHNQTPGTDAIAGLNNGVPFGPIERQAELLASIELPVLDKMRPRDFSKFLKTHENELARFRHAFSKLGNLEPGNKFDDALAEIRYEVSELCLSDSCASLRNTALKMGGTIALSAAVVGSVLSSSNLSLATAAVVGVGTAASILEKLYDHHASSGLEKRKNPYYVGFKLGMDKINAIPQKFSARRFGNLIQQTPVQTAGLSDLHWLTSREEGIKLLAVRRIEK